MEGVAACSAAVDAFAGIWTADCTAGKLVKLDPKVKKLSDGAALAIRPGSATLAAADSLWAISDNRTTVSRIDPEKNAVVAEVRLPAGCSSIAFGESALWAACPPENHVLRIHPLTNLVEQRIEVKGAPVAVATGEGSIWALSATDGKLSRIDPKTHKVLATVELKTPAKGASMAVAEGSVWVSAPGFPLMHVDPASDKVVQQFAGAGEWTGYTAARAVWLSSGNTLRRYDPARIRATTPD